MAEIVLNVQVRDRAGTGGARQARNAGLVPGVLYGGAKEPVSIAVNSGEFRKALHTGKLLGHLVTLKYGDEVQPVIAKDVQFHPVTDRPVHFDLFRVDAHQLIRISVPVHFRNHDASPGLKRGGALNVNLHELELMAPANAIPEDVVIDLTGLEIGDAVRAGDVELPSGVEVTAYHRDATVASIATSSAMQVEEEEEAAATAAETEAAPEAAPEA
jgi:large subunit ribosomal protein L25